MKLTKATITSLTLPPGKTEQFFWDAGLSGFGIRLRGDTRTYVAQFRVGSQSRRKTIGDVHRLDLEAARKVARQLFAHAALGVDTVAERRVKEQTAAAPTVGNVADLYCEARHRVWRPASEKVARMYFRLQWAPLRGLPINTPAATMRSRIAARLHEIAAEGGLVSARQARAPPVRHVQLGRAGGVVREQPGGTHQ